MLLLWILFDFVDNHSRFNEFGQICNGLIDINDFRQNVIF